MTSLVVAMVPVKHTHVDIEHQCSRAAETQKQRGVKQVSSQPDYLLVQWLGERWAEPFHVRQRRQKQRRLQTHHLLLQMKLMAPAVVLTVRLRAAALTAPVLVSQHSGLQLWIFLQACHRGKG